MRTKNGVRKFEKIGSKESAMQEFNSLSPKDVKRVEFNKGVKLVGKVGNKVVVLKDYGTDINSVIEIIDPVAKAFRESSKQRGNYGVRVVYKNKLYGNH